MLQTGPTAGESMNTQDFVRQLRGRGVELRNDNGRLSLSAPRGVIDADTQAELRARKTEILAVLAADGMDAEAEQLPEGLHPLSDIQQSLWYLESEQPELGIYNLYIADALAGELDFTALEAALQALLERHEMLRAVLTEHEGQPVQKILPASNVQLAVEPVASRRQLASRLQQELVRPFDKQQGPLHRHRLFRLSPAEHVLLLVVDHVIADGTSMAILRREFFELYSAHCDNREPQLSGPEGRYVELVRDERRWMNGHAAHRQLEYWKEQLGGDLPQLELPADHPRPSMPSGRGDLLTLQLSEVQVNDMARVARNVGASTFMFITAVVAIMLSRLSGQREVIVGAPFANRHRAGSEAVVGLFINPVALRICIDPRDSFEKLLQQVRDRCMEAFDHQAVPFDKIVESIAPQRDSSQTPIFQALVTHLADADHAIVAAGITAKPVAVRRGTAQTDIAFWCRDNDAGISVDLEYSTDLFTARTARQLLQRFENILADVLENPLTETAEISVLSDAERKRLLDDWGKGPVRDWPAATIDSLVRQQCKERDVDVASSCGEEQLSYDAIGEYAAEVGSTLAEHAVGRGDVVGVLLDRDARLPGVLLGILERGAAWLPLDGEAPGERLQWMMQDAGVRVVLTNNMAEAKAVLADFEGRIVDLAASTTAPPMLQEDRTVPLRRGRQRNDHIVEHAPDDVAYIIYTSGSTGRPKGVRVPHACVTNFLCSMHETLQVSASDRFLALTTLTFDISVLELLLPLSIGAHVEMVSRDESRDGDALLQRLERAKPTVMQATPATWQLLLSAGWDGHGRLTALSGGEALPAPMARELLARADRVFNMYGPTETTVWSSVHPVSVEDDPVSIGRPIANTQVYVLDAGGQLAAPGVPGELYIGGDGVTHGYLNRPALNEERFVPDPFSEKNNARLYRTGDRVRFLDDGRLEYLGRVDFQIKLRGHRIEPGEIENALESHAAVERAVVVVRNIKNGAHDDQRLVAYITLATDARVSIEGLREHLRQRLPAYMLPQHFVDLERMPLTPSGKIDRKALPSPTAAPRAVHVPPEGRTEQCIAKLWQEMLGVEAVSANDNFFDLGGHSLSSMKVIARIDEELGVRLRPRLLVLNTLREIAAACNERRERNETRKEPREAPRPQAGKWKSVMDALFGRG